MRLTRAKLPMTPPTMAPVLLLDDGATNGDENVDRVAEDWEVAATPEGLIKGSVIIGCGSELPTGLIKGSSGIERLEGAIKGSYVIGCDSELVVVAP